MFDACSDCAIGLRGRGVVEQALLGAALRNLGIIERERGDLVAADTLLAAALSLRVAINGEVHTAMAETHSAIAGLRNQQGRHADAERHARTAVDQLRALVEPGHRQARYANLELGTALAVRAGTSAASPCGMRDHGARWKQPCEATMTYADSPQPAPSPVTRLLRDASHGNTQAFHRLLPLVYDELRRVAQHQLSQERPGHTLSATALVHEAYLKLVGQDRVEWSGRSHFFAVASQAMRRVLVTYAEARRAEKRGGGISQVSLDEATIALSTGDDTDVLDLHEALQRLEVFNPRGARVVEYRFFAGMAHPEIAEVLGVSEPTVRRAWAAARAWLRRELGATPHPPGRAIPDGAGEG